MSRFAKIYDLKSVRLKIKVITKKLMKNQCGSGGNCRDEVEDPV